MMKQKDLSGKAEREYTYCNRNSISRNSVREVEKQCLKENKKRDEEINVERWFVINKRTI
jgi:hypothetical protein